LLGQVEGRTADDAAYWLLQAPPAWRDRVEVVAIDMWTVFLAAVRRALPQAQVAVDLFHVVQLAVKAVGDVRRRATREKYGRRGKEGDPEYGIKGLLNRNLESLSPAQFARVIQTLDADGHGQQIALAWITKEKLRAALNLRAIQQVAALRTAGKGPALRLLRLVRRPRGHPRAHHARHDDLPVGGRDRHRRPDRRHQRDLREPQPPRETRGPPRLRLPQPRQPAPPRLHRLHTRHPTTTTHRNQHHKTIRN
jgi:hypothetical protein